MPEQIVISSEERTDRRELFMELLDPVHDNLARFARGMTRDREEARDLVAETVLVAFEGFDRINDHRAFLGYLFTIAHRLAMRGVRRRKLFGAYDEEKAAALRSTSPPPDASADIEALYAALAKLPAEQREAVVMFEIAGLSLEEIRTIQGGTLSGVKARVARGRKKLARLLGVDDAAKEPIARQTPNDTHTDASSQSDTLNLYSTVGNNG
jgi:RNA polymerase sigma-70 factor (ECF subfamily)